jgi:hypothetical protein
MKMCDGTYNSQFKRTYRTAKLFVRTIVRTYGTGTGMNRELLPWTFYFILLTKKYFSTDDHFSFTETTYKGACHFSRV